MMRCGYALQMVEKLRSERAEQLIKSLVTEFKNLGYTKEDVHKLLDENY